MEQLVRYRNNCWIAALALLAQCSEQRPNLQTLNADSVELRASQGILYVDGEAYSGTLYSLYENTIDTVEVRNYLQGKEDGIWRSYHANGRIQSVRYFNHGKKEGQYKAWWEDGSIRLDYNFSNDEYEGAVKDWSASGILTKNMHYRKGHEDGLQQQWDATGKIWANYEARNGRNYGITGVKACATLWKNDSVSAH